MLKNKKAIYVLIPINILVWGFFIYRFYSAFTESDSPMTFSDNTFKLNKAITFDSVVYKLDLQYKDPFLKQERKTYLKSNRGSFISENNDGVKSLPVQKPVQIIEKKIPEVKYLGLVQNTKSGISSALVTVNGQSKLVKVNESIEGITFKSFGRDSLVARCGKERIVARK